MKYINLSISIVFLFLLVNSCKKNPCENVACINGGACQDGTCLCPSGFSGVNCEIEDPCRLVNCGSHGHCVTGNCVCDAGYEGVDCNVLSQTKFMGYYQESGSCDGTGAENFLVTITSSFDPTKIIISGMWGISDQISANLTANGSGFTIPSTTITGTSTGTIVISGNGTRFPSNQSITANFTVLYTDSGVNYTDNCLNILWTKL